MKREVRYKKLQEPTGWESGNGNLKAFTGLNLSLATAENNQNSNDQKKYCIIKFDDKISDINNKHDLLKLPGDPNSKFIDFFNKKIKNNQTYIKENGFLYEIKNKENKTIKVVKDEPVKIIYKKYTINIDQIEELEVIKKHLEACIIAEKDQDNNAHGSDIEKMEKAVKSLCADQIDILQISDFNTNGAKFNNKGFADLPMKERNRLPWYAILHASGIGAKDNNDDNHGSHGVGKFANFHLSSPRTVLYRSRYSSDDCFSSKEQIQQAFGGRVISRSHELDGKNYGSEANIGTKVTQSNNEENLDCVNPYTDPAQFPEFIANEKSDETGLDIFIIGFRKLDYNWENDVIASTLCKFQIPIMKGDLEVEVGDKVIDKNSISKFYNDEELFKHLEKHTKGMLDPFKKAKWYYELFKRDPETFIEDKYKTKIETFESNIFGSFKVRMLINNSQNEDDTDNPLKEIKSHSLGWFRQGMFICDSSDKKPSIIGEIRFNKFPPFFASIECETSHGIQHFKDRENAKHDDFIITDNDNLKDEFKKLKLSLRENLRKWICGEEKVSGFGIPELNEIFDGSKNPGNAEMDISNQKKGDEKVKDKSEEDKYSGGITFIPKRKGKKSKKKGKRKGTEIPVITRGKIIELDEELIWRHEKDKNTLIVTIGLSNKKAFKGRVYLTTSPSVGSPEPIEIDEVFYGASKCVNGMDYFEDSFKVNARNQYKVKASSLKNSRVFEVILGNMDEVENENKQ
jgi:hypothetical protein